MKAASLFVAALTVANFSTAPAKAVEIKCSYSTWPMISVVQCTKPTAANYAECGTILRSKGLTNTETWAWCRQQQFKS